MSKNPVSIDQLPLALQRTASPPVLPSGAPYLLRTMSDDDIGVDELVEAVSRFPVIAARLIGLANSAWSSPVNEVTRLDQACIRLGMNVVRSVSIALSVASPFNPARCPGFDVERFWASALLTAEVCSWLVPASSVGFDSDPQSVRVAGLLHNLGLLWLADAMPKETNSAIIETETHSRQTLAEALRKHCGIDYAMAGGYLGGVWKLPESLVIPVARHPQAEYDNTLWKESVLVGAAEQIVSMIYRDEPPPVVNRRMQRLSIPDDSQGEVMQLAEDKLPDTKQLARTLFSS